jgi:hypothetical protein
MKFKRISQLIIVTAFFLALLVLINSEELFLEEPRAGPVPAKIQAAEKRSVSNFTVYVSGNMCEGCHMSGKPFIPQALTVKPHTQGGAYCLICHKISHEVHPVDDNVTCEKCHGTTRPSMPAFINGSIPCNNCHDYPDPLMPSNGHIITIHRPRGINCNTCHTDECTKCHSEPGKGERWEKRMNHFRTILRIS